MVNSLCQNAFDSKEWQSISAIGEAKDDLTAVLEANTILFARVYQKISNITSSWRELAKHKVFWSLGCCRILSRNLSFTLKGREAKADEIR